MNVPSTMAAVALFAAASVTPGSAADMSTPGPAGSALKPAVAVVHIKDFKYHPDTLTVHVGDRVTFVNDDDEAHTVTATDTTFDSTGMDGMETWQHVFAKAGTFRYFCQLHPYMKATIVVSAAATGGSR